MVVSGHGKSLRMNGLSVETQSVRKGQTGHCVEEGDAGIQAHTEKPSTVKWKKEKHKHHRHPKRADAAVYNMQEPGGGCGGNPGEDQRCGPPRMGVWFRLTNAFKCGPAATTEKAEATDTGLTLVWQMLRSLYYVVPQGWGFSLRGSIISDQTQGREGDMCAESERKEGKWEDRPHHGVGDPGPRVHSSQAGTHHRVKPQALEPLAPLLFLKGEMSGYWGTRH